MKAGSVLTKTFLLGKSNTLLLSFKTNSSVVVIMRFVSKHYVVLFNILVHLR